MRVLELIGVLALCAAVGAAIQPAYVPQTVAPVASLGQEIKDLMRLVPSKPLKQLVLRYMLSDAEFQAFIRALNTQDAYALRMRIRSQPEILNLQVWLRSQMMVSGDSMEIGKSLEISGLFSPFHYAMPTHGWQGFINEFLMYYPLDFVRAQIDAKVAQNGAFAQFWTRVRALKPVYERILAYPEAQRIIATLQAQGINTSQLDQLIRQQFDWFNVTVAVPGGPVAVHPPAVGVAPVTPATVVV